MVDRHYFTSVYVREPNHVLFELATDGPGFEVDGPIDRERLSLPPFLEPRARDRGETRTADSCRPINTRRSMELNGIHHLTAVSAKIRDNHHFYTSTLGMRLVKRSVNQDDVSAYHLFYADAMGTPGHRPDLLRLAGAARAARHALDRAHRTCASPGRRARSGGRSTCASSASTAGEIAERDGRADARLRGPRRPAPRARGRRRRGRSRTRGTAARCRPSTRSAGSGPITLSVPDLAADRRASCSRCSTCARCASTRTPTNAQHTRARLRDGRGRRGAPSCTSPCSRTCRPAQPGAGGVHHVAFRTPDARLRRRGPSG